MTDAVLSLGANLGNRSGTLHAVITMIRETAVLRNIVVSPFYETEPVGYTEQPSLLNCAVRGVCSLSPDELAEALRNIEKQFGRQERPRWHEREIDIDIILLGDTVITHEYLCIPHPRMSQRRFVLQPVADIAPSMNHPIFGKTIQELLDKCTDTHGVVLYRE